MVDEGEVQCDLTPLSNHELPFGHYSGHGKLLLFFLFAPFGRVSFPCAVIIAQPNAASAAVLYHFQVRQQARVTSANYCLAHLCVFEGRPPAAADVRVSLIC